MTVAAEVRHLQHTCEADDECDERCLGEGLEEVASALSLASELIYGLAVRLKAVKRPRPGDAGNGIDFYREVRGFQTDLILRALRLTEGRQRAAAALLGIKATTLNCKIKTFKIEWKNARSARAE